MEFSLRSIQGQVQKYWDEFGGEFAIRYESNPDDGINYKIFFNSLKELHDFGVRISKFCGAELIIDFKIYRITIYDGYYE